MSEMEFEVRTDLATVAAQEIETNFEQVDAYLTEAMAPYTTMAVTEDGIRDAKATLAKLRKLRDAINAQKIAVKREWMRPYTDYERKAKTLMGRVDAGIENLDGQIKGFETDRIEKRKADLEALFREQSETVHSLADFERLWEQHPHWQKKTMAVEACKEELLGIAEQIERDYALILRMDPAHTAALLEHYKEHRSLALALALSERLKDRDEETRKATERKTEEQFRQEEPEEPEEDAPDTGTQFIRPAEDDKPLTVHLAFQMDVTPEQASALKRFLTANGIKYKRI